MLKYERRVVKKGPFSYYGEIFIPFTTRWGEKNNWFRVTHECMTKWGARRDISKWLFENDPEEYKDWYAEDVILEESVNPEENNKY